MVPNMGSSISDQHHAMTAGLKLGGEGVGRNHMSAGTPGSENEIHPGRQSPLHLTTYGERVRYGFRRVKASSKPMPIDSANIELPP